MNQEPELNESKKTQPVAKERTGEAHTGSTRNHRAAKNRNREAKNKQKPRQ